MLEATLLDKDGEAAHNPSAAESGWREGWALSIYTKGSLDQPPQTDSCTALGVSLREIKGKPLFA